MVRRTISFLVALLLFLGGSFGLFDLLVLSAGWSRPLFFVALTCAVAGGAWLFEDFIRPNLNKAAPPDRESQRR